LKNEWGEAVVLSGICRSRRPSTPYIFTIMKKIYYVLLLPMVLFSLTISYGGNPDRQGEAGAYELLMNPWARSAGLHSLPVSMVRGVEAMRLNVAGISRINKLEVQVSHAIYLEGTDISMNALGVSTRVGQSGAFALSLMALDFGEIRETTVDQPEGTGATFSPNFFNLGLGYAYTFENKISVGIAMRAVSESISDLSAFGLAVDAGVQYVTGEQDNFKFGISLRNVGTPMKFSGEGLVTNVPVNNDQYELALEQRSASFELPSMLNIGLSYDFLIGDKNRVTAVGNFTSNSFSRDQLGGGIEYALNEMFMLRAAYRADIGAAGEVDEPIYTGLSAGASLDVPITRGENKGLRLGIDYAYRATKVWSGTHNLSVRINI
jgi:hypothetical protein